MTEERKSSGVVRLSDWILRPLVLEQDNNFDDLTRGLTTQLEMQSDQFFDSEVRRSQISCLFLEAH